MAPAFQDRGAIRSRLLKRPLVRSDALDRAYWYDLPRQLSLCDYAMILLILVAGLIVVVGGIVFFRLHAFFALIFGALVVAFLTPEYLIFDANANANCARVASTTEGFIELQESKWEPTTADLLIAPTLDDGVKVVSKATGTVDREGRSIKVDGPLDGINPGDVVIDAAQAQAAFAMSQESAISRITDALGVFFGKLAILIVCASVIGRCLLDSGAADRIVRSTLSFVGERLAPAALVVSGFVLGIPVFFDTVFYLMIPLGKTLRARTGKNYLLYVLSIVAGATMAHSLVPPTPGPLAVAEVLGVDIGQMMFAGSLVALTAAAFGLVWAIVLNKRANFDLPANELAQLEATTERDVSELPNLFISLLPIVLPVALISLKTITGSENPVLATLSNKNIALLISATLAMAVYIINRKPARDQISEALQSAIGSAGTILLITCAGGVFGRVLNQTNVASLLRQLPDTSPVLVVVAAFFVTTAVRTAQGSATVAMMTAAGIFGPIVTDSAAGVAPLYVALAIGCGSKPVAWMNDSGFWIITRMSGMSEVDGLKYVSPMTATMGLAGLGAVIAAMKMFPLL